jgi:hypothetical protein
LQSCGVAPQYKKEFIMSPIDVSKIEQQARRLRAEEIQRIQGLMQARLGLYFRLLAASVLSVLNVLAESVRPLFAWNPQASVAQTATRRLGPGLPTRLSLALRALFSWNPQAGRS